MVLLILLVNQDTTVILNQQNQVQNILMKASGWDGWGEE
jgi:hypothetical protein